jgi:hypothetical protein
LKRLTKRNFEVLPSSIVGYAVWMGSGGKTSRMHIRRLTDRALPAFDILMLVRTAHEMLKLE